MKLLDFYEKVERTIGKLPEPLQRPILKEISPLKELFLLQRPPRFALLGERSAHRRRFVNALAQAELLTPADDDASPTGWHEIARVGQGRLQLLDARLPASLAQIRLGLGARPADVWLFLGTAGQAPAALEADLDHAVEVLRATPGEIPIVGLLLGGDEPAREEFHSALHARVEISRLLRGTFALSPEPAAIEGQRLAEFLARELPDPAKVEIARLSGAATVQAEIAQVLIKSTTAICAAIGTQPIPLADFPLLTSLQIGMVTGIMHVSGREMNPKHAAEFLTAAGANLGAGLVLREGARAALKLMPFWGYAISGGIAAAGTYAIGRSATAYFIHGVSLREARRLFSRRKNGGPKLLP